MLVVLVLFSFLDLLDSSHRPPLGAAPPDLSARMANVRAAAPPFPEHCALRYPRSGPVFREKGAARSHGVAEGSFSKA